MKCLMVDDLVPSPSARMDCAVWPWSCSTVTGGFWGRPIEAAEGVEMPGAKVARHLRWLDALVAARKACLVNEPAIVESSSKVGLQSRWPKMEIGVWHGDVSIPECHEQGQDASEWPKREAAMALNMAIVSSSFCLTLCLASLATASLSSLSAPSLLACHLSLARSLAATLSLSDQHSLITLRARRSAYAAAKDDWAPPPMSVASSTSIPASSLSLS